MWALRLLWNFVPTGWPVINGMVLWCLLEVPFSTWSWLLLLLSRISRVQLCATPQRQPTRLPCLQWEAIFGFLRHYHRLQHPLVDCLSAHHTKSFLPCPVLCIGAANFASEGRRCFSPCSWPEPAGQWYSVGISIPPAWTGRSVVLGADQHSSCQWASGRRSISSASGLLFPVEPDLMTELLFYGARIPSG